jgi:hypothetical protein
VPANCTHADYDAALPGWIRGRELLAGEDEVKAAGAKYLPRLDVVFHGAFHSRPEIGWMPLADVMVLNLDHYRLDADYKHGLHFTALPTAWVAGFDKPTRLTIG